MKKEVSFWLALLPLIIMITAMAVTIVGLKGDPHLPLMIGTAAAAIIAKQAGFTWKDIEESMYKGIKLALPAIVIIILVGLTIGSWIGGGIVATMVFYGLKMMTPSLFLVSICIICAVVCLAIGSSWSTMATIGVAGMGIGLSMGLPAAMIAGAVISGAYFGDKLSPLSDTTNLASGLTGTDLFEHIKFMLITTIPSLLIALMVYWLLGRSYIEGKAASLADIENTMLALQSNFVISPWLLLIPLAVIVLCMFKVPAVPALVVGIVLGSFSQLFIQGDALNIAVSTLQNGYAIESENSMVNELFNGGGIEAMMYTVSLTIVAMTFGGVLENTGMLEIIVQRISKIAKTAKRLIITTVFSSFATNISCSEQYISIVVPARMYAKSYENQNLHSKNLSRAIEDGGTLTSVFVPWNTCGVFIFATLGVHAFQYAPYAILNFTVPLLSIILTLLGRSIVYRNPNKKIDALKQTKKVI
ncbi:Na+/H+ antiporter NhaC [Oceanobacillus sp. J11TS1]|uniref:Na+/H+ antiporter NhaC n=1 Tax=Oceanobacillus sp. J11TS1 TaxID=2807191 RepID=UPI001B064AC8|nr:Na+/H+ antiporter NhaC [Oceanobacillus sp. J11TS1]GIO23060.1 Na+/H+ antiporter NhaC [Oceanobacillus sp. J11TS1]